MSPGRPIDFFRSALLTSAAMIAFAGNSVICRLALADQAIDAASFTVIRLLSGAMTLLLILMLRGGTASARRAGSPRAALALFVYAVSFSFAYLELETATGALILFAAVQATIIVAAVVSGERPGVSEWSGWAVAACGFVAMLLPGASAPSPVGATLMAVAGIGWGMYTLYGRAAPHPLAATTGNFLLAALPSVLLGAATFRYADISATGALLAVLSGAVTTGLGYVIWYAALTHLSSFLAALVQLTVPAIAAVGGLIWANEVPSERLMVSGLLILGGLVLAIAKRNRPA